MIKVDLSNMIVIRTSNLNFLSDYVIFSTLFMCMYKQFSPHTTPI